MLSLNPSIVSKQKELVRVRAARQVSKFKELARRHSMLESGQTQEGNWNGSSLFCLTFGQNARKESNGVTASFIIQIHIMLLLMNMIKIVSNNTYLYLYI